MILLSENSAQLPSFFFLLEYPSDGIWADLCNHYAQKRRKKEINSPLLGHYAKFI